MKNTTLIFVLENQQVEKLKGMIKKGKWRSREIERARILLKANAQNPINKASIAREVGCHREKVGEVINRFLKNKNLDEALFELPRSGQPFKLNITDKAFLIATACSKSPSGTSHWSLQLLQKQLFKKKKKKVVLNTIRKVLLKSDLKPWKKKYVVYSEG